MLTKKVKSNNESIVFRIGSIFDSIHPNIYFLLLVVLLTYGYELFGFHLTIDEEIHADYTYLIKEWFEQGRWGMGILSMLIPSTVVPVVSPMLGIVLSLLSWWWLLRNIYGLDNLAITLSLAVAITFPVLAFSITFTTLAYGIGVGNVFLVLFVNYISRKELSNYFGAILSGAIAISIYQTFLFGVAILALFEIYRNHEKQTIRSVLRIIVAVAGSVIAYIIIDYLVRKISGVNLKYVGGFIDVTGVLNNPAEKLHASIKHVVQIIGLSSGKFGLHSPWLLITLLLIAYTGIRVAINKTFKKDIINVIALIAIVMMPILADLMAKGGAPLRSVIYFPLVVCIIVGIGYTASTINIKLLLLVSITFTIIGNATVINRLFNASEIAYRLDQALAHDILIETRKLMPNLQEYQILKLEVVGQRSLPVTRIMPKSETFGASFFEWDSGNRYRAAAFLRLSGLTVIGAEESDRVRVYKKAEAMPVWPVYGWVSLVDDTLIVKLSGYTSPQKNQLCSAGLIDVCAVDGLSK